MRLRAGMGALLLALGGCAGLPEEVRLDMDGRSIEVRQHGFGARWALDSACKEPVRVQDYAQLRLAAGGELTATGPDGRPVRLFPCR